MGLSPNVFTQWTHNFGTHKTDTLYYVICKERVKTNVSISKTNETVIHCSPSSIYLFSFFIKKNSVLLCYVNLHKEGATPRCHSYNWMERSS